MYEKTACHFWIKFITGESVITYKFTRHYNYLQTHLHLLQTNLQASKLLKAHMYSHILKIPSSLKLGLNLNWSLSWVLIKYCSLYADVFQVFSTKCGMTTIPITITKVQYFIKYSVHFFTWKMMLKYSLHTIHGR